MENKETFGKGIYPKYIITNINGPTDPKADYFVLRLDNDASAREAAITYARSIKETNLNLSLDLFMKISQYDREFMNSHSEFHPDSYNQNRNNEEC